MQRKQEHSSAKAAQKVKKAAGSAPHTPKQKAKRQDTESLLAKSKAQDADKQQAAGKSAGKETKSAGLGKGSGIKRWLWLCCGAVFLLVLSTGSYFYQQLQSLEGYLVPYRDKPYELVAGATAGSVIHDLAGDKFHRSVIWAYVRLNQAELSHIQKGSYAVDGITPLSELLQQMTRGDVMEQKPLTVALVEGMNALQIEKRLAAQEELTQDAAACFKDPKAFLEETLTKEELEFIGGARDTLEGLLMPATYPYFPEDSAKAMLQRALRSMVRYLMQQYPDASKDMTLKSPYEVLILASIVEKETSLDSEKPLIAGVFYNRLNKGMRLQTDASVMYGVGPDFRGPLKSSQLKKDTPYNTYTREGLPPTPIAMPSSGAVAAVLHPETTDAIYFVAKSYNPKDGHNFAKTLREHNRNVSAYKKSVREYKQAQKAKN